MVDSGAILEGSQIYESWSSSAMLMLAWSEPSVRGPLQLAADAQPLLAKIGVLVEDLTLLPLLNMARRSKSRGWR